MRRLQVRVLAEGVMQAATAERPPDASGSPPPAVAALMGDFNSAAGSAVYQCAPSLRLLDALTGALRKRCSRVSYPCARRS